ncbi:MAG: diguanylate cyclase [Deltaproteobacteria bacterium]|nr:diguanylate cyclase [Deltaproteobacteria bacterium]
MKPAPMNLPIRNKLFLSHLLLVVFIAGTIGVYFYISASQSLLLRLQERLQASAALIGPMIDADEIRHLRGIEDTSRPDYINNLAKLRTLRRMNPDIAYLYVMRQEGEKVYFVLDSDETKDQALPGHEYKHRIPSLLQGFTAMAVDDKIIRDEWGSFLSGYAPIRNSQGEFLVGIDMRADEVTDKYRHLRISGLVSLLAAGGLAFVLSRFLADRFMVPIDLTISRCARITGGHLDEQISLRTNDEFDRLLGAFNTMSATLAAAEEKKRQVMASLRQARDELEIRVRQRTNDLKEVNDKLTREIAERLAAQKALQEVATIDPLTRLYNRRSFLEQIEHEAIRSRRNRRPFAVVMVDIDHFKNINDDFGHAAGDSILMETALRMKGMLRGQDMIARWGGEEFVILLVDTDLDGGAIVAEKIRRRIADGIYYFAGETLWVTASFGLAEYQGETNLEELIKAADTALYRAKERGRDRVEIHRAQQPGSLS